MESMDCDVCFHQYDEEERQPRTLSCGHTLCNVCIGEGIINDQLTCPFCREVHKVTSASDIPVLFALLKVLRTLSANGNTFLKTSNEKTASAALPSLTALEPELHAGVCAEHGSYRLFWCNKCQVWVCRDCTVVEHPSGTCSIIAIKQALKIIRKEEDDLVHQTGNARNIHVNSLTDYQTKLSNYDRKHDEQLESFQELIEQQKELKCLLKKEHARVQVGLSNGHEALEKMVAANKTLTEESTVEGVTAARHGCQRRRRDLESWIKSSEEDLTKSDALKISEKMQNEMNLVLEVADIAQKGLNMRNIVASWMHITQKVQEKPTVENLLHLAKFANVWVVADEFGKAAPLTRDKDRLHIHALRLCTAPASAFHIPYDKVRTLVKTPPEVFIELSWGGQKQGCFTIQMKREDDERKPFLQRCTGEDSNSFVNSKMIQVLAKNSHTGQDHLCGGGDGSTGNVKESSLGPSGLHSKGWVTLATLNTLACFAIWYRDFSADINYVHAFRQMNDQQAYKILGIVTSNLEIVEAAANQPDVTNVEISECGLVL